MRKNKIDRDRSMMLAGIVNENEKKQVDSELLLKRKAANGRVYAIVREKKDFYIKETFMNVLKKNTNKLISEDFNYIGGLIAKNSECYPSFTTANRRLSYKLNELSNAYGDYTTEGEEDEETQDVEATPEPIETPAEEPQEVESEVEAPDDDTEDMEAPAEDDEETEDDGMVDDSEDMGDDEDMEDEDSEDEDDDSEDEDDNGDSLSTIVGRFTQQLGQIEKFSASETKNVLNSVISVMKSGISKLDDNEISKLAKRIKKKGAKVNESDEDMCEDEDDIDLDMLKEFDDDMEDDDMDMLQELEDEDSDDVEMGNDMKPAFQPMGGSSSDKRFEINNAVFNMNETEKLKHLTKKVLVENMKGKFIKTDNKIINAIQEQSTVLIKEQKYRKLIKNIIKEKTAGKKIVSKNPLVKTLSEQIDREMKRKK